MIEQHNFSEITHSENPAMEDKYGVLQFRLPGSPFNANSSRYLIYEKLHHTGLYVLQSGIKEKYGFLNSIYRDSITIGRLFMIRTLEEMNMAGYEPCINSCLSR